MNKVLYWRWTIRLIILRLSSCFLATLLGLFLFQTLLSIFFDRVLQILYAPCQLYDLLLHVVRQPRIVKRLNFFRYDTRLSGHTLEVGPEDEEACDHEHGQVGIGPLLLSQQTLPNTDSDESDLHEDHN